MFIEVISVPSANQVHQSQIRYSSANMNELDEPQMQAYIKRRSAHARRGNYYLNTGRPHKRTRKKAALPRRRSSKSR